MTNKLFSNGRNAFKIYPFFEHIMLLKSQPPKCSKIRYLSGINESSSLWMFYYEWLVLLTGIMKLIKKMSWSFSSCCGFSVRHTFLSFPLFFLLSLSLVSPSPDN